MNSVERVKEYDEQAEEGAAETAPDVARSLPAGWPAAGALSVRGLRLRYRPELPLVLKDLDFEVAPGEKVGIVGRTGSGKSSLFLALFRMVEPEARARRTLFEHCSRIIVLAILNSGMSIGRAARRRAR